MAMATASVDSGVRERTIVFGLDSDLARQRREKNRPARSLAGRKERFEKRVEIAKRAKAILADPQWKKKLAAADSAIEAARKELEEAEKPRKREEAARLGVQNADALRNSAEAGQRTALHDLQREADAAEDYILSEVANELQRALDEVMRVSQPGRNTESARKTLKAALVVISKLPYEFVGSWGKFEAILVNLKKLAETRGMEAMVIPQWDDGTVFEE
jgi:hypothetical protein